MIEGARCDQDKLIILAIDFLDPAYPDQKFFCWHCALMEGLLSAYPDLAKAIDVERISWPKPRQEIVDLIGLENQSVPVLILADNTSPILKTKKFNNRRFIDDKDAILHALAIRHSIALPHP